MVSNKLFNEWYGYDKKLVEPEPIQESHAQKQVRWANSRWSSDHVKHMPEETANEILNKFGKNRDGIKYASVRWMFDADSYTQDDYLKWLHELPNDYEAEKSFSYVRFKPWYSPKSHSEYLLNRVVENFFSIGTPRSDVIFRLIELKEFMTRGNDEQSFEEFLLTDTEYKEKCRKLDISVITRDDTDLLLNSAPKFFQFNRGISQKTRNLFLPLNKSEMEKVLDYKNNPIIGSNFSKSHTNEWAEIYFKSALGQYTRAEIKIHEVEDIKEHILYRIIEKYENFKSLNSRFPKIDLLIDITHRIQYLRIDEDSQRGLSHLINENIFNELEIQEILALTSGYEKTTLWAVPEKGKSAIEILTEMMIEGTVDPVTGCKLVSHIVTEQKDPIKLTASFDWSSIKDMPIDWAYSLLESSESTLENRELDILVKIGYQ